MTFWRMGMSIPRAATSVTTRMLDLPLRKSSTCIRRASWSRAP